MSALTVFCVEAHDYLGLGAKYVRVLRAMVARHLRQPHRFVCLTDEPARHPGVETEQLPRIYQGWWNKIELYRPGRFYGRALFIDLDVVIVGGLDEVVEHKGTVNNRDWGWPRDAMNVCVTVWDAGEHAEMFTKYSPAVAARLRDDMEWATELGGWQALPNKKWMQSYRYHSVKAPPADAKIVFMHGKPKPHEIKTGWVPQLWQESVAQAA